MSLTALSSTEVFDPKTNSWAAGPDLSEPRSGHTAVLTSEGVWFAGGLRGQRMVLGSTERIDAKLQRHDGPTLVTARAHHTANTLGSAEVMRAYPVSPVINSGKVEGPACIETIEIEGTP